MATSTVFTGACLAAQTRAVFAAVPICVTCTGGTTAGTRVVAAIARLQLPDSSPQSLNLPRDERRSLCSPKHTGLCFSCGYCSTCQRLVLHEQTVGHTVYPVKDGSSVAIRRSHSLRNGCRANRKLFGPKVGLGGSFTRLVLGNGLAVLNRMLARSRFSVPSQPTFSKPFLVRQQPFHVAG